MKCKECRDFKQCLYEANRLEQIFDPEYEFADCFAPISNADHIRSLSDEGLAAIFCYFLTSTLRRSGINAVLGDSFQESFAEWLAEPYKEGH